MTHKNRLRPVLLATLLGLAGVGSASATGYNNDLLIGFSDGVGNDLIYDLGAPSAVTNSVHTYNLASLLSTFDLTTVSWGVIGNSSGTLNNRLVFATSTQLPQSFGSGIGNGINTAVTSIYQNFPTAGAGQHLSVDPTVPNSWNAQTINPTLPTQYKNVYLDPTTAGSTSLTLYRTKADSSAPVILGSFSLGTNGVVTYTPLSSGPSAPTLIITRSGNTSSISFLSASSATYTLYLTNSTGLTAPASTWPSLVGTITGDGTIKTFTDTTTDRNRFYRVKAQ